MRKDYWQRVRREAWRRSAHDLHIETPGRLVVVGTTIFVAIIALAFWGSADASRDEAIARIAIAACVIGLLPIFFLWNMMHVPAQWDKDQRDALEQTSAVKATREQIQAAVDDLSTEIKWATKNLLNRHSADPSPLAAQAFRENLIQDIDAWFRKINEKLSNNAIFKTRDRDDFENLGFFEPIVMTGYRDLDHHFGMLRLKFERLRTIIDRRDP